MNWEHVITIIAANVGLIYWVRQDTKNFIERMESWKNEIKNEMRDFHDRLCAIKEESENQDSR